MEPNPLVEYLRTTRRIDESATELLWRFAGSSVTLTAPHNKATFRDGEYKRRDTNVGVLAIEAAKIAQVNALVPLTPGDHDGNWHTESKFRTALNSLLDPEAVILDIHGMADHHGCDVVLGTANGRSPVWLVEAVAVPLRQAGFTVEIRHAGPLSAQDNTLTWALLAAGHAALQIEVAWRWRDGASKPEAMTTMIEALAVAAANAAAASSGT